MTNLLTDLTLSSAYTVTGSFADIADMSATVTIAGTGSVVILMMSLNPEMSGDECAEYRFTHDGARVGPVVSAFADATDEGTGRTLMFALTGLSAGSHTFAVQAVNRSGTAVIDTAFPRTFQIVEIESGASILVDLETSSSDSAPASFANMANLSQAQTPAAGALLLFIHGSQILGQTGQKVSDHRFAIDGTRDGPNMTNVMDNVDETTGVMMAWGVTGVSAASHTFSVQWERSLDTPIMDTARPRVFQVIEITEDFDLLVDLESVSADSAAAGYTDIADMSGTPVIDSTDSIALVLANYTIGAGSDETSDNRLSIGGSLEGAEVSVWTDAADRAESLLMARAVTGESGSTAMSLQWKIRAATPDTDTARQRTFQVIDLKAVSGVTHTASGAPSISKPTSTGSAIRKITATGAPSISKPTSTGSAIRKITATGAPAITKPTSTGEAVHVGVHIASGAPSISKPVSAGEATRRVTASGAPSITKPVSAGSAIRKITATGAPAITKPTATGVAVHVGAHTASGAPSITKPVSAGSAIAKRIASGAPSITKPVSAGEATVKRFASGTPSITKPVSAGEALVRIKHEASGAPSITKPVSAGEATRKVTATGAPSINQIIAAGSAITKRIASGAPSITKPVSAGTARRIVTATGAPSITKPTSTGSATVKRFASGAPSITKPTSTGEALTSVKITASGAPSISKLIAAGSAITKRIAAGSPSISKPTSSGAAIHTIKASGAPSITKPTSTGVAFVPQTHTASGSPSISKPFSTGNAIIVGLVVPGSTVHDYAREDPIRKRLEIEDEEILAIVIAAATAIFDDLD